MIEYKSAQEAIADVMDPRARALLEESSAQIGNARSKIGSEQSGSAKRTAYESLSDNLRELGGFAARKYSPGHLTATRDNCLSEDDTIAVTQAVRYLQGNFETLIEPSEGQEWSREIVDLGIASNSLSNALESANIYPAARESYGSIKGKIDLIQDRGLRGLVRGIVDLTDGRNVLLCSSNGDVKYHAGQDGKYGQAAGVKFLEEAIERRISSKCIDEGDKMMLGQIRSAYREALGFQNVNEGPVPGLPPEIAASPKAQEPAFGTRQKPRDLGQITPEDILTGDVQLP